MHCEYWYWDLHSYLRICGFTGMVIHLSCLIVSQNGSGNGESRVSLYLIFMYVHILLCLYLLIIVTEY